MLYIKKSNVSKMLRGNQPSLRQPQYKRSKLSIREGLPIKTQSTNRKRRNDRMMPATYNRVNTLVRATPKARSRLDGVKCWTYQSNADAHSHPDEISRVLNDEVATRVVATLKETTAKFLIKISERKNRGSQCTHSVVQRRVRVAGVLSWRSATVRLTQLLVHVVTVLVRHTAGRGHVRLVGV